MSEEVEGFFEDFVVGEFDRVIAAEFGGIGEGGDDALVLDIFGDVNDDGAWAAGLGDVKGFLDDAGDVSDVPNEVAVFDDGEGHSKDVSFLECAAANHLLGDLSCNSDEGDGVHVSVGDASDKVCGAGSASSHADACAAGCAGVAFSCEDAALLVAWEDDADLFGAGEGLVDGHGSPAGVSKDHLYAFTFKTMDEELGAVHFAGGLACGLRAIGRGCNRRFVFGGGDCAHG